MIPKSINNGADKLTPHGQKGIEPKTKKVNWVKFSPSKSYSDGDENNSILRR